VNVELIMKAFATAIMGFCNEPEPTAGMNPPPQPGACPAGEPNLPSPAPAVSAPSDATASRPVQGETLPPARPVSVVAKVAKILINQHHDSHLERRAHWEEGCLHQKVLTSLNANHQL
jgi:hypothetical protein